MPPMRTTLFLMIALVGVGCGDDGNKVVDAPAAQIDAPPTRPVLPLTSQAYCDTIQATCTGTNAQYADAPRCLAAADAFAKGAASTETTGNTLGCRIYHAQNAMIGGDAAAYATHCPHAGPAGAKIDAATGQCGSPCESFCAMDTKICGTDAAPVTGVTNRYTDLAACMTACAAFDKTVPFSAAAPNGNTFACRVAHLTNAALYTAQAAPATVNTHCGHTLSPAQGVCVTAAP
jgi:hypothetical protein